MSNHIAVDQKSNMKHVVKGYITSKASLRFLYFKGNGSIKSYLNFAIHQGVLKCKVHKIFF